MKLIIDIPNDLEKKIRQMSDDDAVSYLYFDVLLKGTPLPKGHGRLIDADDFFDEFCEIAIEPYINAPTIIEADKEQTESEE